MQLDQRRIAKRANWIARHGPRAQRVWTRLHGRLYKLTGGRFIPRWFAGAPVMVLETIGHRSGRKRASPVLYLRDGDDLVVMASNAGTDQPPAWWRNLLEAGEAEVVVRGQRSAVKARVLEPDERRRLWPKFVEMYPQAGDYAGFTEREIPLAALRPEQNA